MAIPEGQTSTVAQLIERRLSELERNATDLAAVVQVPTTYIDDLIAGRRLPPLPSRTDIYPRMTSFLGLGRNELTMSAQLERKAARLNVGPPAKPAVRRSLLKLCKPETAAVLKKDRSTGGTTRLADLLSRLLNVAQMEALRLLQDPAAQRGVIKCAGSIPGDARFALLEFLDATTAELTTQQVAMFVAPRIVEWDADTETDVLKVVLRSH